MQPTVVDLIASADRGRPLRSGCGFTALCSELQRYKEWRLDDPADARTDSSASESQRPATGKRREYLRDYLPLMRAGRGSSTGVPSAPRRWPFVSAAHRQ